MSTYTALCLGRAERKQPRGAPSMYSASGRASVGFSPLDATSGLRVKLLMPDAEGVTRALKVEVPTWFGRDDERGEVSFNARPKDDYWGHEDKSEGAPSGDAVATGSDPIVRESTRLFGREALKWCESEYRKLTTRDLVKRSSEGWDGPARPLDENMGWKLDFIAGTVPFDIKDKLDRLSVGGMLEGKEARDEQSIEAEVYVFFKFTARTHRSSEVAVSPSQ